MRTMTPEERSEPARKAVQAPMEEGEGQALVSHPDHRRHFVLGGVLFVSLVVIALVGALVAIAYFK